jgi:hypothetical protein
MSELALAGEAEKPSVGKVQKESSFDESRVREAQPAGEQLNTKILDHINNGLLPEQIDRRLESDLQAPEVQRALINEFSPYSDKINPFFRSTEHMSGYTKLGLKEAQIQEKPCLQDRIDPEKTDGLGRTNRERTAAGLAPLDANGESYNLDHIGQKANSPLAELPNRIHKEFDDVFHDKSIQTEVHFKGNNWNQERAQYWKERSKTL